MRTIITNVDSKMTLDSRNYVEFIISMDRMFKDFLNLLKKELLNLKVTDVNSIQGLIIYNLGYESIHINELVLRGYYTGSNISYNLKKLIELGYIDQMQSETDKRSSIVRLTSKGVKLLQVIERIFLFQVQEINKTIKDLKTKKFKTTIQKTTKILEELLKR